jgi:hypothetical protein
MNMSNVRQETVPIQLGLQDEMSIKLTHSCDKTYYAVDATGTIRPITTKTLYVSDLKQDFFSGRALILSKYLMIMDEDQSFSVLFPVVNKEIDLATGFPFAGSNGRFYIRTIPLSELKYASMSGYKLWHQRMGHCSHQSIKATISHATGLEED